MGANDRINQSPQKKDMSQKTEGQMPTPSDTVDGKKPGLLGRLVRKLDEAMKRKAEEKSGGGSCCGGSSNKGGKCC